MGNNEIKSQVCTKCNLEKPISEFYRNCGQKTGYMLRCKKCYKGESFITPAREVTEDIGLTIALARERYPFIFGRKKQVDPELGIVMPDDDRVPPDPDEVTPREREMECELVLLSRRLEQEGYDHSLLCRIRALRVTLSAIEERRARIEKLKKQKK